MQRNWLRSESGVVLSAALLGLLCPAVHAFQGSDADSGQRYSPVPPLAIERSRIALTRHRHHLRKPVTPGTPHSSEQPAERSPITIMGPPVPVELASHGVFGPPLSPERAAGREQARRLLADYQAGCLVLTVPEREEAQLRALAQDGLYCWPLPPPNIAIRSPRQVEALAGTALPDRWAGRALPSRSNAREARALTAGDPDPLSDFDLLHKPPSSALLRMLATLTARSTPERPLELLSLLRPLYRIGGFVHVGPVNPHSLGLAVDIAAYAGRRVRQDQPEECVEATLALLRDLPPGRYRLGLPKAPDFPLTIGQAPLPPFLLAWLSAPSITGKATLTTTVAPHSPQAASGPSSGTPLPFAPVRKRASIAPSVAVSPAARQSDLANGAAPAGIFLSPLRIVPMPASHPGSGEAAPGAGLSPVIPDSPVPAETAPPIRPGCIVAAAIGATLNQWSAPWPFFPAPEPLLEAGLVAPEQVNGKPVRDASGRPVPAISRFRNEDYADAADLGDRRVQRALLAAQRRGVEIVGLFPDGADHIHIDVRQSK